MTQNIVDRAAQFAIKAHGDQIRKYTGEPYWNHPMRVAETIRSIGLDDETIAAAWLHDVVEDCEGYTHEMIDAEFGPKVSYIVEMLTDVGHEYGNRARRKEIDSARLAMSSPEVQSIKLADLIDNTSSIVAHDPGFAVKYLREKADLLKIMVDGDPELYRRALHNVSGGDHYYTKAESGWDVA